MYKFIQACVYTIIINKQQLTMSNHITHSHGSARVF